MMEVMATVDRKCFQMFTFSNTQLKHCTIVTITNRQKKGQKISVNFISSILRLTCGTPSKMTLKSGKTITTKDDGFNLFDAILI